MYAFGDLSTSNLRSFNGSPIIMAACFYMGGDIHAQRCEWRR